MCVCVCVCVCVRARVYVCGCVWVWVCFARDTCAVCQGASEVLVGWALLPPENEGAVAFDGVPSQPGVYRVRCAGTGVPKPRVLMPTTQIFGARVAVCVTQVQCGNSCREARQV